ncbi:tRNA pseudouridine(38-40) synthase TruA [Clostridium sp. D43t1_170807_H7]|uniref:tRNA pseudouridine(38-40) synthase TruA n=1 Tax=Clostridium sp. D43t1_170807_H7 TaxID=2787140 RepID=UPI001898DF54|nr:tRNA pseudouridine(38-40) synthase TruA [Clostridium sp. D43t1_170807_H7]MEE0933888.1 tRNA pseudouridine(38-40) synthase TruA [Clostridium sp.]
MRNIRMTIQYDGSRYKGWQKQNIKGTSVSTIQDKIEKVLSKMTGEEIQVIGCGRTDTGVHADKYTANFKTNSEKKIPEMLKYLREFLPEDISVTSLREVSDRFHSRLNAISKTYVYTIDNNKFANVFLKKYAYHVEGQLDIEKMREASKYLLGTHDFKGFSAVKDKSKKSTIRTINYINITEKDNIIKIEYNGNGFLLNMVRILSGTLIKVAKGEIEPIKVKELLEEKSRSELAEKAPAKGLCMKEVKY